MDNDLMARRLRPPSEPPRPTNGHSAPSPESPPWAQDTEPRADIPWDVPADETWPPAADATEYHSWPPAPAPVEQVDASTNGQSASRSSEPEPEPEPELEPEPAPEPETETPAPAMWADEKETPESTDRALPQQMWESGPSPWDRLSQPAWASTAPWDAPASEPEPEPEPAAEPESAAEPEPAAEPVTEAVPEPVAEPQPEADTTDVSVPGRPSWDKPAPWALEESETFDDRPADMLASYDEMTPVVTRAVAAAQAMNVASAADAVGSDPGSLAGDSNDAPAPAVVVSDAEPPAADPYDAFAPVLGDVTESVAPAWPAWNGYGDAASLTTPVVSPAFAGKVVGPTPPDDLFEQPSVEDPAGVEPEPPEQLQVSEQQEPSQAMAVFATGPATAQPLVLRIELAIVDGSIQVRPADAARRVGPVLEVDDADAVTPRHPEFEPRNHIASGPAVEEALPEPTPAPAPWGQPADSPGREPVDLPWALPPLESVASQQTVAPWAPQQQTPATPIWAQPSPTDDWTLESAPTDPLSSLPAATFAPVEPVRPAQPVAPQTYVPEIYAPQAAPVFEPGAPAQSAPRAMPAPVAPAAAAPAAAVAAATTRPAANAAQADLWFLASEPEAEVAGELQPDKSGKPSSSLTAGLTIAMAVVVIVLVLVFIQLMTSLLR